MKPAKNLRATNRIYQSSARSFE